MAVRSSDIPARERIARKEFVEIPDVDDAVREVERGAYFPGALDLFAVALAVVKSDRFGNLVLLAQGIERGGGIESSGQNGDDFHVALVLPKR